MEAMIAVGSIVALALMIWCMSRERKLAGFYSEINVCGRWYAFFTGYCLLTAVACPIMIVMSLVQIKGGLGEILGTILMIVATCGAMFLLGFYLYRRAAKKCSEHLKKRLFWDMLVIALGFTTRISLIFMLFLFNWWMEMNKPVAYEVDGRTVYAYPGSDVLYDEGGSRVGTINSDGTRAIMD